MRKRAQLLVEIAYLTAYLESIEKNGRYNAHDTGKLAAIKLRLAQIEEKL